MTSKPDMFIDKPEKFVGKTISKALEGVDGNFLLAFTDGTWGTTPVNGDCDYWVQDAVLLGMMTQEEADAELAESEEWDG